MRVKTTEIKSLDYIPLTFSYICNLCSLYLLIHQYNVLNKISSASIELQLMYWGVNVIYGLMFLSSLLLIVKTHPQELKNR